MPSANPPEKMLSPTIDDLDHLISPPITFTR